MGLVIGYLIWALFVSTLPAALLVYFRTRRKAAVVMLLGAALVWGGIILGLLAEPKLVSVEQSSGIVSHAYAKGSTLGNSLLMAGTAIFVLCGAYLASTGHGRGQ